MIKPKKCKICEDLFQPINPFQIVCGYICANKYAKLHLKKESDNLWKKQKKELKIKTKTLTQLIKEARKPFQQWIRLRDKNHSCISCGTKDSLIWDAGHFLKAELFSALIFEENNVHKQCRKCNCYLGGNEIGYRIGLLERYGASYVISLENMIAGIRIKKYERQELTEIKNKYLLKIKEHEKNN